MSTNTLDRSEINAKFQSKSRTHCLKRVVLAVPVVYIRKVPIHMVCKTLQIWTVACNRGKLRQTGFRKRLCVK